VRNCCEKNDVARLEQTTMLQSLTLAANITARASIEELDILKKAINARRVELHNVWYDVAHSL